MKSLRDFYLMRAKARYFLPTFAEGKTGRTGAPQSAA